MSCQTRSDRIAELEAELAKLRADSAATAPDGALLKTLLDDIARRRTVEHELNQAHEWLTLAQEAGMVAAYTFDFHTDTLSWSSSARALYGFDEGVEPSLELWMSTIHPDDIALVERVVEATMTTGAPVDQRYRLLRPDGSIAWIQDRGRVILHDDGSPARLVGVNVDVTELVELERRASEDGERLRLALSAGRNACWDWNLATNEVVWDSQLSVFAGVDAFGGDFQSFWDLVHAEDKPLVRAALDRSLATGSDYAVEFRMVRPDGSIRWTRTQGKVVHDKEGKPVRVVGIDCDITETKLAHLALNEGRRFLVSVLGASPDCIKVIELDGTISFMNANGQQRMEITDFDQVRGRRWTDLWPPECHLLLTNALERAKRGERTGFDAICPTAAGTPKWWDVSVAPINGEDGTVQSILAISRDITDRKQADDQLQLLNAELHHRIKNNLATVQALARATMRGSRDLESFDQSFSSRLEGLGKTYGLLKTGAKAASLQDLVDSELGHFADGGEGRIVRGGPDVQLSSTAAVSVGMILHELTTNACKYGCLNHPSGRLAVCWTFDGRDVRLVWEEDCTAAASPANENGGGFGSVLIDRLVRQLKGTIRRRWERGGLVVELILPDIETR
ncbi:hypothetical protein GCM10022281_03720 [Sphingomonas rosea]|uniref:histidine kinase n=1 Tax=Sphingomonas rosea TaxID=335605 RepID=A0ABP7TLR1_9SPHN